MDYKMNFFIFLSLISFSFTYNIIASQKEYIVLHSRDAGMFSMFMDVLSLVHCYEKGLYSGMEVNFGKEGLYYDEMVGDNWWSYYCEPICLGEKNIINHVFGDSPGAPGWIENHLSRKQAHRYIQKYIHIKPEISKIVDDFHRNHLAGNFVISVHYRGTDKFTEEAPFISYEQVVKHINRIISSNMKKNFKIFIATDEANFIYFMKDLYGDKVCYNEDAFRSTDGEPLHLGKYDHYKCGLDALIDCLLLSRGDYLIRTSSNLSCWSTYLNPHMRVHELSRRT
jgi:hypothetical protein